MKIRYYGHSCFEVQVNGKWLLFDPFITPNDLAKDINVENLRPDYLLLSHGHEDHVADAITIYKQAEPTLISNFEIVTYYSNKIMKKAHGMNLGGGFKFDFGSLKYVQAVHSSVLPDGTYAGNPGGFVIRGDKTFYYSGDTALHYNMKLIGESEKLDFAFLCIGDNFTMGVDDAIKASDFINCDKIIGMHYDTFPPIVIDHEEAVRKFSDAGKELILMSIGEEKDI